MKNLQKTEKTLQENLKNKKFQGIRIKCKNSKKMIKCPRITKN